MGRRVGQLAGLLAFVLALGRLGRLLEDGPDVPPWLLILLASSVLGGLAWWLLSQLTKSRRVRAAILAGGALLLALRVTVPQTLAVGILPTGSTPGAFGAELDVAWRTIRTGIAPVEPFIGLIAVLAVAMWVIGACFSWGMSGGPNAAMFVPSLVMYFQFAVFDRADADLPWMLASAVALILSVVSMALERREEVGRARDADGRPLRRKSLALSAVMASVLAVASVAVAASASDVINEYGNVPWQGGTGLGPGPGSGVSYDGLVELQQRILNQSEVPVFTARLAEDAPSGINPYWKVDTLDTFNGQEWSRSDTSSSRYEPDSPVVAAENLYLGTTNEVLQTVQIQAMNTVLAPTAGTPIEIQDPADNVESPRFASEFYSVGDVSVGVSGGLSRLDQYQLRTALIDRTADLGALATDETGDLSPMFSAAQEAGEFATEPRAITASATELADRDRYLALPEDTPSGIGRIAREITAGHATDFEAAWMLQSWFRDGGDFTYSVDVSTGHDALVLDDWLNDPESTNYRTGYCEQFAAGMGVLARALGIPSRVVWGFTPGEVDDNGIITVRDTNAHAWVELWMEPYGWFPFDPTPRAEQTAFDLQPPSITADVDPADYLEAPVDNDTSAAVDPNFNRPPIGDVIPEPFDGEATAPTRWWLIAIAVLIPLAAASIPTIKAIRRRRRLSRIREGDITAAWDEIVDRLTDLGVEVPPSSTPVEFARSTNPSLLAVAHSYSSTVYGGRTGQASESDLVEVEWWLERHYESRSRLWAGLSLRSLFRDP